MELNQKNRDAEALLTKIGLQTEKVSQKRRVADAEEQKVSSAGFQWEGLLVADSARVPDARTKRRFSVMNRIINLLKGEHICIVLLYLGQILLQACLPVILISSAYLIED